MNPYELNVQLKDKFIQGWYISSDVCDRVINEFKVSHNNNKTYKNTFPRNYYVNTLNNQNYKEETVNQFLSSLSVCYTNYLKTYEYFDCVGDHHLNGAIHVQYFKPPEHYSEFHTERTAFREESNRTLVFITYLNDVIENGETEFFYQKIKIKPKKGLTIMWPTEWTHTHRGISTNEEKYIVTGWFEFDILLSEGYINLKKRTNFKY